MPLIRNENNNGVTKSIFQVSDDKEAQAYQSLVDMDSPNCPNCRYPYGKLKNEDMIFVVVNPLSQTMGMDLAMFTPRCSNCGKCMELPNEMDINPAFPTAVEILKRARANYAAMKAKQSKAKGGSNGKG